MNRSEFQSELAALIKALQPTIADDYRAYEDSGEDSEPSMLLTVGADDIGWSYQTGDTSYMGGAYGYLNWGQVAIDRDDDPMTQAARLLNDLEDGADEGTTFFYDEVQS